MSADKLFRPLGEVGWADVPRVGRKAATLGELLRAGFLVPDGFVITVDALIKVLTAGGSDRQTSADRIAAAAWPEDVLMALADLSASVPDAALAVRSSGVGEDSPGLSFAGQFETILDVRGPVALLDAVRRCWQSAFSERLVTYREAHHCEVPAGLAVLVQRMVPAEAAGVAFSVEPVTGRRDEALVSAVRGLGDQLVSGRVTPDDWAVRGTEAVRRSGAEDAIDAERAREIASLARRAADHCDGPQEIEWALYDRRIWLLQSRPITGLADSPRLVPRI